MSSLAQTENRARISRATCGWKKPGLPLDAVRRYWRDVHSPAIARRAGVYDYRHAQFGAVREDLFATMAGIDCHCPADEQLMWLSDVRYLDEDALAAFGQSPDAAVRSQLLADIELIVEQSTTYRTLDLNARTYVDRTAIAAPQGVPAHAAYALFFRRRSDEGSFFDFLRTLAARWAEVPQVVRLRLTLFEVPDMEAERRAGYPIKTHPLPRQYQAWMELFLTDLADARALPGLNGNAAGHIAAMHCYPIDAHYTFVYGGRPTLVGLRGFAAYEAINALGARNQRASALLEWMYGPIVQGGPLEVPTT